jgi:2,3-dihydroxybenzoate decarboxylase
MKRATRPSKEDYRYYFTHNISITTSGNFNTRGLKFCMEEIGHDRCLYAIGMQSQDDASADTPDTPYDTIKEAQDWWKSVDLPEREKAAVARENAIRLFKLPLGL